MVRKKQMGKHTEKCIWSFFSFSSWRAFVRSQFPPLLVFVNYFLPSSHSRIARQSKAGKFLTYFVVPYYPSVLFNIPCFYTKFFFFWPDFIPSFFFHSKGTYIKLLYKVFTLQEWYIELLFFFLYRLTH